MTNPIAKLNWIVLLLAVFSFTACEKEDLTPLSCFHLIHLECAKNLISLVCPICDSSLESLPIDIENQIKENNKKYQNCGI